MPSSLVELTGDGEHSRRHSYSLENLPQQGAVNGVVRLLAIDEAQEQRYPSSPSHFLETAHHEHHVRGRAVGVEARLLFGEKSLGLALVIGSGSDDLEEDLARVCNE